MPLCKNILSTLFVYGGKVSVSGTYVTQQATITKNAAATLTAAEVLAGFIQYTGAVANLTLPTGAAMDAAIALNASEAFILVVLNTGSGAVTLLTNTGMTLNGNMTVAAGASQHFMFRKASAATYGVYQA